MISEEKLLQSLESKYCKDKCNMEKAHEVTCFLMFL